MVVKVELVRNSNPRVKERRINVYFRTLAVSGELNYHYFVVTKNMILANSGLQSEMCLDIGLNQNWETLFCSSHSFCEEIKCYIVSVTLPNIVTCNKIQP